MAGHAMGDFLDVVLAATLALAAAFAVVFLPPGDPVRVAVAVPVLLVVPGYLLLQAALVPARPAKTRAFHGALALGLSPAVVGLAALSTALIPNGFTAPAIVAMTTGICLFLALFTMRRRTTYANHADAPRERKPLLPMLRRRPRLVIERPPESTSPPEQAHLNTGPLRGEPRYRPDRTLALAPRHPVPSAVPASTKPTESGSESTT